MSLQADYDDVDGAPSVTYHPDRIGDVSLSAGPSEQVWEEYGLELVPVRHDGADTGQRLVRRNGEFIAMVSDRYQLLPNEEVVAITDDIARELGAVPFSDYGGDWYINLDDHIIQDHEGRRAHALYAWEQKAVGDNDIEHGLAVHNSIDGSLGLHIALFTFNNACQNMVWIGVQGEGMGFDEREVISYSGHKHTSGLDVDRDAIRARIENVLYLTDDVNGAYESWRDQFVTVGDVKPLIERFPHTDLPGWLQSIDDALDEAAEESDDKLSEGERESIIRDGLPAQETVWSAYNDFTEAIWHSESGDTTKRRKYRNLHRVYDPIQVE